MRKLIDGDNAQLSEVLENLLANDIDITVREVCRRHPLLKNPSAFTRNPVRIALIEAAQNRQLDARHVRTTPLLERSVSLGERLAMRDAEATSLQAKVEALVEPPREPWRLVGLS